MRMTYLLDRPASRFEPAKGLLLAEHFQMAYATNDLDRACDLLGRQLGIREFGEIGGETASGGQIRVKLAWVGSIMYELMWAEGPGSETASLSAISAASTPEVNVRIVPTGRPSDAVRMIRMVMVCPAS